MAEFPALPIFTDALLGDTQHLSAAEFGGYMLMLIVAWRSPDCALPNDDKSLARIARAGRQWGQMRATILAFWTLGDDGKLRQKKLSNVRLYVSAKSELSVRAGNASALKRKKARSTDVAAVLQPNGNRTSTSLSNLDRSPSLETEIEEEKKVRADSPPSAPLGNGVELSDNPGQLKMPDIPLHQVRPENGDWSFALFRQGLAWLSGATQQTPAQLRPLVGRWLKQFGDDHRGLFDLMAIAQRNAVADPRAWISAHLPKGQKNGHATGNRGAAAWANFALTGSVEGSDPDPVPE